MRDDYALSREEQMDTEVKLCRSLPPLVDGKIHGTLKVIIDEIVWTKRTPGGITVVASWWGEHDSAQFRPIDSTAGVTRTNEDKIEIYAIKTNATLFEDYIKNCGTIELLVIAEKSEEVIATAHVDLSTICERKLSSQFVPVLNGNGGKLGELHVSLQLTYFTKLQSVPFRMCKYNKEHIDNDIVLSTIKKTNPRHAKEAIAYKNLESAKENSVRPGKVDTYDTYRSVLKEKRAEFRECKKKHNEVVTDKLITQIVARAQRLRGAILKETYNEDPLALSDGSMSNESYPCASLGNEAKLYEYILGKEMTLSEEKKALDTLKLTSPASSLIDLASKMITACENKNVDVEVNENFPPARRNNTVRDTLRTHPVDYVDSIRIFIESFTLSPAGYRRARSTCLQYGASLSLTYFVQYDTAFGYAKQSSAKRTRFTRICAKKQIGQVIDFNAEGVYNVSRDIINRNFPLKFKLFVRHQNHRLLTELGYGSININDIANTATLSATQNIIITNKGMRMGELKLTIELGSDCIHFGKEFVDAVTSAKENIPVLGMSSNKYRSTTGTHSTKSSNKVSSVSTQRIECLTNDNSKDLLNAKNVAERQERSSDNRKVDTSNPESTSKDKVLLHGLIYVAEGKDLPESNTYLICRAFWREDKATSQICSNTKNPFYHFFQLVPLIHGTELLERIRDNYIIIEVYSRQNGRTDNLLGIAKLPVHQLYVAYRDPLVLPHLLLSKYPVISVDDWVSINDPVNGKYCGELFALVALGTAEQIALLEVTRGLRNTNVIPRSSCNHHRRVPVTCAEVNTEDGSQCGVPEMPALRSEQLPRDNSPVAYHVYGVPDRDLAAVNYKKSQESQTDISSLEDHARAEKSVEGNASSEQLVLHALVDRLASALHVNRPSANHQSAQTETAEMVEGIRSSAVQLNGNSLTDDSDSCSPRNDFQLPTEMYRSVGVGAEYDEELDQRRGQSARDDACDSDSSVTEENTSVGESNTPRSCDDLVFRALVEIECALHLPTLERLNGTVEPSTYVSFQDSTRQFHSGDQSSSSHVVTSVFPRSCNPKWNWRGSAKLPTDLLSNNQKRLILKVWHLIDPDASTIISLERDVVIGFSAIDLSVLMAGFPTVSGWFHIMDFTGKCNGQIKVTITPLDGLLSLGKFAPNSVVNLPTCGSKVSQTNLPRMYDAPYRTESNGPQQASPQTNCNQERSAENQCNQSDFATNVAHGFEDVSMSFLSLSLKQKLTELEEITKRLQSRLHDVTSDIAFEDDFDNDFDMIEQTSDNENADERNAEIADANRTLTVAAPSCDLNATTQVQRQMVKNGKFADDEHRQASSIRNTNYESHSQPTHSQACRKPTSCEPTSTGYSTSSDARFAQRPGHYRGQFNQNQARDDTTRNYLSDNIAEYAPLGERTHINHLLDKLSLDLPPGPPPAVNVPMKKDILELFASLREHRTNWQEQDKITDARDVNTCSVVTQTDKEMSEEYGYPRTTNLARTSGCSIDENVAGGSEQAEPCNKMSTVIREELAADESNDSTNCDELTTYLITSNIRHMNMDGIFNPLLYQYLVPDVQVASAASPENKAVEQLDNRYDAVTRSFDRMERLVANGEDRADGGQVRESTELLRLTPSGISANVDSNIDVTVVHKSSDNDLMSGNSMESTGTSLGQAEKLHCSTLTSEISVPRVSRQAPEGGNPVEEIKASVRATKRLPDDVRDVLSADS